MAINAWENTIVFDAYAVTATTDYVYNASGGTAATAGWHKVKYDDVIVQIGLATLAATTFSYRIEGKFADLNRTAEIYSSTATGAMSVDELVNVTERIEELRVGIKVDNAATPNVFYSGIIMSERK